MTSPLELGQYRRCEVRMLRPSCTEQAGRYQCKNPLRPPLSEHEKNRRSNFPQSSLLSSSTRWFFSSNFLPLSVSLSLFFSRSQPTYSAYSASSSGLHPGSAVVPSPSALRQHIQVSAATLPAFRHLPGTLLDKSSSSLSSSSSPSPSKHPIRLPEFLPLPLAHQSCHSPLILLRRTPLGLVSPKDTQTTKRSSPRTRSKQEKAASSHKARINPFSHGLPASCSRAAFSSSSLSFRPHTDRGKKDRQLQHHRRFQVTQRHVPSRRVVESIVLLLLSSSLRPAPPKLP